MSASVIYVRSLPAARVRVTHVIRVGSSHGTWRTATGPGLLRYPTAHLSPVPGSDRAMPTGPTISSAICAAGRVFTLGRQTSIGNRPVGEPYPPRAGDRGAGSHRADQPRDRRAAVPVGAHRRGARRPHPVQARVPDSHSAGGMDASGRPGAANYVVALRSSSDDPAGFDVDRCCHERNTDINVAWPGCWRRRDPHRIVDTSDSPARESYPRPSVPDVG